MLTNPAQKVRVFSLIADFFIAQPEYRVEGLRLFEQAYMSVKSIQSSMERTDALSALAQALAQADYWQQAQEVIASIKDIPRKAEALRVLGQMLMQADRGYQATQVWQQAQEVISCITDRPQRARARSALVH